MIQGTLLGILLIICVPSVAFAQPGLEKPVLVGEYDCLTGRTRLTAGVLGQRDFTDRDAAIAAMRNELRPSSAADELVMTLRQVCSYLSRSVASVRPVTFQAPGSTTPLSSQPILVSKAHSLLVVEPKDGAVRFTVARVEAAEPIPLEKYVSKDAPKCEKISEKCMKCDSKIYCGLASVGPATR
jgi:hypothetical protein